MSHYLRTATEHGSVLRLARRSVTNSSRASRRARGWRFSSRLRPVRRRKRHRPRRKGAERAWPGREAADVRDHRAARSAGRVERDAPANGGASRPFSEAPKRLKTFARCISKARRRSCRRATPS